MMKKLIVSISFLTSFALSANAQIDFNGLKDKIKTIPGATSATSALSNDEIIKGLKEALTVGTNNSTSFASALDGFYKNTNIKIPFPPSTKNMETTLRKIG